MNRSRTYKEIDQDHRRICELYCEREGRARSPPPHPIRKHTREPLAGLCQGNLGSKLMERKEDCFLGGSFPSRTDSIHSNPIPFLITRREMERPVIGHRERGSVAASTRRVPLGNVAVSVARKQQGKCTPLHTRLASTSLTF